MEKEKEEYEEEKGFIIRCWDKICFECFMFKIYNECYKRGKFDI